MSGKHRSLKVAMELHFMLIRARNGKDVKENLFPKDFYKSLQ